ncbi:hypothetical protein [Streptomyces dubilierae]|uniref:Uncharacterized protein n=1 Tax=Streptomyces dubilierae TaxID=3075533 RepID=A0ABU2P254_9ACTN|nr:hypothetical protein [Streptomyces sp. DSM 41921]MDT0385966.1 hypothetical protein [Streptomyces sp. DSM 41921]
MRDVARMMIERAAPHELVIFYPESKEYFKDPDRALDAARRRASARPKDREGGFGAAESVEVLTPFALAVAGAIVEPLVVRLLRSATTRSREGAQALVRRLLRRERPAAADEQDEQDGGEPAPVAWSVEERAWLWERAYREALRLGLDDRQARRLADGLVDRPGEETDEGS